VNFKNTLKTTVAVAALYAIAAPVAVVADDTLSSGNKNSLKISGQVSRAVSIMDDGISSKTAFTDGNWTNSRIRWVANGKVNADVSMGATIEMNIPKSNDDGAETLGTPNSEGASADAGAWGIRHQFIYASSKQMGKIYMGQTSVAADGSGEASFNGTGIFAGSDGSSYGTGVSVARKTVRAGSENTASGATVGGAIMNMDHNGRADVIRYDSPKFEGVQLKTSVIDDGTWDVAGSYNDKFDDLTVRFRAGFTNTNQDATKNFILTGSLAVKHDSGLWAAIAGGKTNYQLQDGAGLQDANDGKHTGLKDPHFYHLSVGYNTKMFNAGPTGFTFNYNQTNDGVMTVNHDDGEGEAISLQAMQTIKAVGAKIGLEYVNYSYEDKTATVDNDYHDIDVITLMTVFAF